MPLTHKQIAKLTRYEVDAKISSKLDTGGMNPYTSKWRDAGELLDMMSFNGAVIDLVRNNGWAIRVEMTGDTKDDIYWKYPTAPEAIARCWLEWWEVTHDPTSSGA